jgi:hypothetical protein
MPDTRAHDEVYCPDCGLQWVAAEGVHTRGCRNRTGDPVLTIRVAAHL